MKTISKKDSQHCLELLGLLKLRSIADDWLLMTIALYNRPRRYYHNFKHIRHSLAVLKKYQDHAEDLQALTLAIWFHDIESGVDHELRSIELMHILADKYRRYVDKKTWRKVESLIMATKHPGNSLADNDHQLIHDIDLQRFTLPLIRCIEDTEKIKREYYNTPDYEFYSGVKMFLISLLEQPKIFYHPVFATSEKVARNNIKQLIEYCQEKSTKKFTN